jgi:hypothetical protein
MEGGNGGEKNQAVTAGKSADNRTAIGNERKPTRLNPHAIRCGLASERTTLGIASFDAVR